MKRHVKPCRYGTDCRHEKGININTNTEDMNALKKTLKELLDYKDKSEAKIKSREKS